MSVGGAFRDQIFGRATWNVPVRDRTAHLYAVGSALARPDAPVAGAAPPKGRALAATDPRLHQAIGLYLSAVWRVLRRSGLSTADCEDISQEAFWVLAQKLDRVPDHAVRAFLLSTALKLAANRLRSRWHRSVTEPLDPDLRPSDALPAEDALDLRRARDLLDRALAELALPERTVFIMVCLEQMSRSEVAAALEIPEGTVASRLKRGRQGFEAALGRLREGFRSDTHD